MSALAIHQHEAHHVKKGAYAMLKGNPCKIVDVKTSKTGKHGHAKCNITGVDVFTNKKYNEVKPGHIQVGVPDVTKTEYSFMYYDNDDNDFVCLDEKSEEVKFAFDNTTPDGQKILEDLAALEAEDEEISVTVLRAPVEIGSEIKLKEAVIEVKKSKPE